MYVKNITANSWKYDTHHVQLSREFLIFVIIQQSEHDPQ